MAQPSSFLNEITFQSKEDYPADFLKWERMNSEEEYDLERELNALSPAQIEALPDHTGAQLIPRIYSFHELSSVRRGMAGHPFYAGSFSMSNYGLTITYDYDEFSNILPRQIGIAAEQSFTRSMAVILPKNICSLYIRVKIFDNSKTNALVADVLFQPYIEKQIASCGGFAFTLDMPYRRLSIGTRNGMMSNYNAIVYSRIMPYSAPTTLFIKGSHVYANGNVSLLPNFAGIFMRAYIIPPVILLDKQSVAKSITEKQSFLECLLYKSAALYQRFIGCTTDVYKRLDDVAIDILNKYKEEASFDRIGEMQYNYISV
ncbi:MAG: hypothetical protein ACRCX2_35030 [Paraclostridium sp.]